MRLKNETKESPSLRRSQMELEEMLMQQSVKVNRVKMILGRN